MAYGIRKEIVIKTIDYPRRYEYQVGGLYLIRKSYSVYQIEVLAISEKAYRIRWESGNSSWVEKDDFYYEYTLLEHLNKKQ